MSKVYLKVRLDVDSVDEEKITEMLENMDYKFSSNSEGVKIQDTEIQDWNITEEN